MRDRELVLLALDGLAARVRSTADEVAQLLEDARRGVDYSCVYGNSAAESGIDNALTMLDGLTEALRDLEYSLCDTFPAACSPPKPEPAAEPEPTTPAPEASDDLGIDDIPF